MKRAWVFLAVSFLACGGQRKAAAPSAEDPVAAQAEAQIRRASQPDWDRLRELVAALGSEEGTGRLFRENPALGKGGSEEAFRAQVRAVRPLLTPLPAQLGPTEAHVFTLSRAIPGRSRLSYDWRNGLRIEVELDGRLVTSLAFERNPAP